VLAALSERWRACTDGCGPGWTLSECVTFETHAQQFQTGWLLATIQLVGPPFHMLKA